MSEPGFYRSELVKSVVPVSEFQLATLAKISAVGLD